MVRGGRQSLLRKGVWSLFDGSQVSSVALSVSIRPPPLYPPYSRVIFKAAVVSLALRPRLCTRG